MVVFLPFKQATRTNTIWIITRFKLIRYATIAVAKYAVMAVYKHIPDYFPDEVGVVGGMVGVLGGLGGFFCPILFGYLLEGTGLWSSCWILMLILSAVCLIWMHKVVQKMADKATPGLTNKFEKEIG